MRKLIILFLCISFSLRLPGQPDSEPANDSTIHFFWDSGSEEWIYDSYSNKFYDPNGNLLVEERYNWDNWQFAWFGAERKIMEYDTAGRLATETDYWGNDNSGTWWEGERITLEYDSAGNQTLESRFNWNSNRNTWVEDWRTYSEYDPAGNRTQQISYYRAEQVVYQGPGQNSIWTTSWLESTRTAWNYKSDTNQIEIIQYDWDYDSDEWVRSYRTCSIFDNRGRLLEESPYHWDEELNDWIGDPINCHFQCWGGKHAYLYDSAGYLTESQWYTWDRDENDWTDPLKSTYDYDSCGNLFRYMGFESGYVGTRPARRDYVYTCEGLLTEELSYSWDPDSSAWAKRVRSVYVWSSLQPLFVDEHDTICGVIRTTGRVPLEYTGFRIAGEGPDSLFFIDSLTGELHTANPGVLDFEKNSEYRLPIEACFEDSTGTNTRELVLSVFIRNINDNPPVASDTTYKINLCGYPPVRVGTVDATDPDGSLNPLYYAIASGDVNHLFSIDSTTSQITINYPEYNEYGFRDTVVLHVQVTDGLYADEAEITLVPVVNQFLIKIVDKASRVPLEHIYIKYDDREAYTDRYGLLFVRNNVSNVFGFTTGSSYYFRREDSVLLTSCDTILIELDPKYATFEFLVRDRNGPLEGARVELDNMEGATGPEGHAVFNELKAGEGYTYSVEMEGYHFFSDTLFLEHDTLVQVSLFAVDTKEVMQDGIRIYPVPAHGLLHIDTDKPVSHMVICDLTGRKVMEFSEIKNSIELGMQKPGIYFLHLRLDDGSECVRKIIKQ